ncbi:dihydroorotase family protein [Candidatus Methanomassiliicoccus intestinalis]|uniref:dihydroorotase family protein n=1 Tax=Candidatus Methanomassiliicoccus intestinalis TaxID=1406512 RepID=UPI0037DC8C3E
MSELVIEGRAYVKGSIANWCIGIDNGKISEIGKNLKGDDRINFKDSIIFPGSIDPHVHFRDPGLTDKEDFSTGSLAAAFAGVTCVLDMPNTVPPAVSKNSLLEKKEQISKKSWVDYGLFAGCVPGSDLKSMAPYAVGFKLFMGSSTGKLLVTEESDIQKILADAKECNKVLSVHAEDENLIKKDPEKNISDHAKNRPPEAEATAINRLKESDCKVNICHVSSSAGLDALQATNFTSEVTAHHLFFDKDSIGNSTYAKVNPPLRTRNDRFALMKALMDGRISMIGSDHAPHTIEDKEQEFSYAPSGMPGVETSVPVLLAMVKKGQFPLERFVNAVSEKPAEIFNLNKGSIELGKDADFMIVNPGRVEAIKVKNLHSKCGWSLFEGFDALFPQAVMLGGDLLIEEGSIVGDRAGKDVIVYSKS